MGFATFGSELAADTLTQAIALATDFKPIVTIVTALAVLGILVGLIRSFTQ
jgi:hypothetical protein